MAASPPTSFNVDDMLMGEILMSLKQGSHLENVTAPIVTHAAHERTSYCSNKMTDLLVSLPSACPSHFEGTSRPHVFNFDAINKTLSPMVKKVSPVPVSPSTDILTITRRGSSKRYGPVVHLSDLRKCFNMPIAAVAHKFGICVTLLKKICRRHGIQRWPHRQIRSLQKSINMLRESFVLAKGTNQEYIAKKIAAFEYTLECIMQDPNSAAKGISAGRLASPATEKMIKRGNRAKIDKRKARDALSDVEESVKDPPIASSVMMTMPASQNWTSDVRRLNTRRASLPMSLQSILC